MNKKPLRHLSSIELNSITQIAHGTVCAFAKITGHSMPSWNDLEQTKREGIRLDVWSMTQNIVNNINEETTGFDEFMRLPIYSFIEWGNLFKNTVIALTDACIGDLDTPKITHPEKLITGTTNRIASSTISI